MFSQLDFVLSRSCFYFFFNDTATTEIYTLSLHDALPISRDPGEAGLTGVTVYLDANANGAREADEVRTATAADGGYTFPGLSADRKSTRLNSSHANISYAVFCLKKKNINTNDRRTNNPAN